VDVFLGLLSDVANERIAAWGEAGQRAL